MMHQTPPYAASSSWRTIRTSRSSPRMALESLGGFTVLACSSGAEALAPLRRLRPRPRAARRHDAGHGRPGDPGGAAPAPACRRRAGGLHDRQGAGARDRRYRELGAADVIAKPFDPMVLAERVRAIWSCLAVRGAGWSDGNAGRRRDRRCEPGPARRAAPGASARSGSTSPGRLPAAARDRRGRRQRAGPAGAPRSSRSSTASPTLSPEPEAPSGSPPSPTRPAPWSAGSRPC